MVSVLMGIHRMDAYVFQAVDSVLAQQGVELELVIVANGPSCASIAATVTSHYCDPRVKVYQTPVGQLAHALNVGLSHASYDLIARMDADDIAHTNRLSRQCEFVNATGNDLVGCAVRLVDAAGKEIGVRHGPKGHGVRWKLLFKNCFVHPTILARKQLFLRVGGYSGGFNCEDYDLWLRMRRLHIRWDNMNDILLDYRIHEAASRRRLLGYAEVAGLMVRELLLTKNPMWLAAVAVAVTKALTRSR